MQEHLRFFAMLAAIAAIATAVQFPLEAKAVSLYNFHYRLNSGNLLSGKLSGTLQGDGNTITIVSIDDLNVAGLAAQPISFVDSLSNSLFASSLPPTTSLDGSLQDFLACADSACNEGFVFTTDSSIAGHPLFDGTSQYGGTFEQYKRAKWLVTPPPVPGPLPWLGVGAAISYSRRLRHRINPSQQSATKT